MSFSTNEFDGHKLFTPQHFDIVDKIDEDDIRGLHQLINKSNLNTVGAHSISFVSYAFMKNKRKSFDFLLSNGADVNIPIEISSNKYTHLINISTKLDDPFYFNKLVEIANLNFKDEKGSPPLHNCVYAGKYDRLSDLLSKGADINIIDQMNYTVLYLLCSISNFKEAYNVLSRGADPSIPTNIEDTVPALVFDKKVSEGTENALYLQKIKIELSRLGITVPEERPWNRVK